MPITCRAKATFSETVLFGQEPEVLEDGADLAAQPRHLPAGEPVDLLAGDVDPAAGRSRLAQHQPQERRLARAGGADEEDELALLDVDGHVVEGRSALTGVGLVDLLEANHRIEGSRSRPRGSETPEPGVSGVAQCTPMRMALGFRRRCSAPRSSPVRVLIGSARRSRTPPSPRPEAPTRRPARADHAWRRTTRRGRTSSAARSATGSPPPASSTRSATSPRRQRGADQRRPSAAARRHPRPGARVRLPLDRRRRRARPARGCSCRR